MLPLLNFPVCISVPTPPRCLLAQWDPLASLKAFSGNPLLKTTAKITLLYYTSVWAVVSTLMVYVARQFQFGPVKVSNSAQSSLSLFVTRTTAERSASVAQTMSESPSASVSVCAKLYRRFCQKPQRQRDYAAGPGFHAAKNSLVTVPRCSDDTSERAL